MNHWLRRLKWLFVFTLAGSCVDRFEFSAPEPGLLTIIEGMIHDQPGPYTVKISQGIRLDADSTVHAPVVGAQITLYDDIGNEEDLIEQSAGTYATSGLMQGQVGRSYHIRVQLPNGTMLESSPDKLNPVGDIQQIRYQYEDRTVEMPWGKTDASLFNVYVDAEAGPGVDAYTRWRFTGTYKVDTYPELHMTHYPPYTPFKTPLPCSGYKIAYGPMGSGGTLEKVGECLCCTCWVSDYESFPQLSDNQLIQGNVFNNIKVGEVLVNPSTFHDKYLVEVEQFSLTRSSFDFFKLIRNQKMNASSLFQPPSGELVGNIRDTQGNSPVVGIFWAAGKRTKSIFINRTDVPYQLTPAPELWDACYNVYPNATNKKHPLWQ